MASNVVLIERRYNDVVIRQRQSDNYMHATAMCSAGRKRWGDYFDLDHTQEFLAALSQETSLAITSPDGNCLVQARAGRPDLGGGTWVHPLVAMNLAQWISSKFAVMVSKWIFELVTTDRVELAPVVPVPVSDVVPAFEPITEVVRFVEMAERVLTIGGLENRDSILLKDYVRSRLCLSSTQNGKPGTRFVTIPERCVALGYGKPGRGQDSEIGKAVARAYRKAHNGSDPTKHDQFIDGRSVQVNTYTDADLPVVDAGIHDFFARLNRIGYQRTLNGQGSY